MNVLREWLPLLIILNTAASLFFVWVWLTRDKKWDGIDRRVSSLEQLGKLMPTREDLHLLRLEMIDAKGEITNLVSEISADRRGFNTEMRSAREHFDQQIVSTEKLIDRTERTANIVLQHLLEKGS